MENVGQMMVGLDNKEDFLNKFNFSLIKFTLKLPGTDIPLNFTLIKCSRASWGVKVTLNLACPSGCT